MKKLKILEIGGFSSGISGVWTRMFNEAKYLSGKGHDITIFSSNIIRGSQELAKPKDKVGKINIFRFPVKFSIGENFLFWNFEDEALKLQPDVIIVHVYRNYHINKALKVVKKLRSMGHKVKFFLVTHAPFVDPRLRGFVVRWGVRFYDLLHKNILNKFDKVLTITHWETPHLIKLGCDREKIVYVPNSVEKEFYKTKNKEGKNILFFGRGSEIKNLEILIRAMKSLQKKNVRLDIVGPIESDYKEKLLEIINDEKISNIKFLPAVYDLKKKISTINDYKVLVLPSKREGMPLSLIEAMSLGKLVISSSTLAGKEIIDDFVNGLIFENGSERDLGMKLQWCFDSHNKKKISEIRKNAKKFSLRFDLKKNFNKILDLF